MFTDPVERGDGFDFSGCDVGRTSAISVSPGFGAVEAPFKRYRPEVELLDEVVDELADRIHPTAV